LPERTHVKTASPSASTATWGWDAGRSAAERSTGALHAAAASAGATSPARRRASNEAQSPFALRALAGCNALTHSCRAQGRRARPTAEFSPICPRAHCVERRRFEAVMGFEPTTFCMASAVNKASLRSCPERPTRGSKFGHPERRIGALRRADREPVQVQGKGTPNAGGVQPAFFGSPRCGRERFPLCWIRRGLASAGPCREKHAENLVPRIGLPGPPSLP
jgi:hypothetical protein